MNQVYKFFWYTDSWRNMRQVIFHLFTTAEKCLVKCRIRSPDQSYCSPEDFKKLPVLMWYLNWTEFHTSSVTGNVKSHYNLRWNVLLVFHCSVTSSANQAILPLSLCLNKLHWPVYVYHNPLLCRNSWNDLAFLGNLTQVTVGYTVLKGNSGISKNVDTSLEFTSL